MLTTTCNRIAKMRTLGKPLASCIFGLAACLQLHAQNVDAVARQFQTPAKAYRPMVRWWWPGGDVNDAELSREIQLLDQGNFGGAEVQPFNWGLRPNMSAAAHARVYSYLSPAFFAHLGTAIEAARSHGMWIDYTFGSAWPFGGAGVTPELASVELASAHQTIYGPVHFHAKIQMPLLPASIAQDAKLPPGWLERFKEREKLVAVVAVRGDAVRYFPSQTPNRPPEVKETGQLDPGSAVVLTDHMMPDGTLDWEVPNGTWQVFAFKEMPTGEMDLGWTGQGPGFVLDHMSEHAFDVYAQHVGDTLRQYDGQYFDNGLRAIFCDSLEVVANLYWSDHFLQEFRKLRGYDLTPYLPILKVPGFGVPYGATTARLPDYNMKGIGDRVRSDYWQTVSDVMIANFYSPFNQWAARNHLLSRVQAHGSPTDLLRVYGAANIPETEDLYDAGRYDFLKMASSGADLYGRKMAGSESFIWYGKLYQTTPEKIKRFADELLTAGVNAIVYHGFPYTYKDRPYPYWTPFHASGVNYSSDVNQTNPFWPFLPRLNQYIARIQYLSQTGTTIAPVALYRGTLAYDSIYSPSQPEPEIDTRLMAAGYNFDHIDAYTLSISKVVDKQLISPGGHAFRALILPQQKEISATLAAQLVEFANQGLHIVFMGGTPEVEPQVVDGTLPTASGPNPLKNILTAKNVSETSNPAATVAVLENYLKPNLRFEGEALPFIEKRIGKLDIFFLRNPDDAPKQLTIDCAAAGTPEVWDAWTGSIRPLAKFEKNETDIRLPLHVDPYGSVLLVFDPQGKPSGDPIDMSAPLEPATQFAVGQNGWKFHGVGIGPGSQPETIDMELHNLVDWSLNDRLKNFSGRGQYTTTFTVPGSLIDADRRIVLGLGEVRDVAEISVNGKPLPALIMRPYRADVTRLLRSGENTVQITVVNTLFNALSAKGDDLNFSSESTNTANGLMPSGLIGPVRLQAYSR